MTGVITHVGEIYLGPKDEVPKSTATGHKESPFTTEALPKTLGIEVGPWKGVVRGAVDDNCGMRNSDWVSNAVTQFGSAKTEGSEYSSRTQR